MLKINDDNDNDNDDDNTDNESWRNTLRQQLSLKQQQQQGEENNAPVEKIDDPSTTSVNL